MPLRPRPGRSSTQTSTRWSPSGSRRAFRSSIVCWAAAWFRDRSCSSAESRASASPRLLLQAAAHFASNVGTVLYCSGEESEHQIKSRGERLGVAARAALHPGGNLPRADPGRDRPAQAGVRDRGLDPDRVLAEVPVRARQHRPGARVGHAAPLRGEGAEHPDLPRRARHEGWQPRRAQGARAHRRHRSLLRRREAPRAPRRARGEEPVRRRQRARRVRDDGQRVCKAVPNPSQLFLRERTGHAAGSAVLCCVEGTRPLLVEVQALVSTSTYGNARRMASGLDQNRLSLLLAVLEKRAGLNLVAEDVFVNVAGGMSVDEPAADLAIRRRRRVERPQPADQGRAPRSSARSGWRERSGARRRPRSACGKRRRWDSRAVSCRRAMRRRPAGCELVGVKTVSEAIDALMDW